MPLLIAPVVAPGSLPQLPQPVLHADDIVLRPWQASDASGVVAAYSEPSIQRWHTRSMTEEESRAWIASWPGRWQEESGAGWAVTAESVLIGQISMRRLDLTDGYAEVSYWVLPEARGRGVAPRALSALTAWAFERLRLHRMELQHSTLNPASCRVAKKVGYGVEGTKRSQGLHSDGWHDMHLHARLNDDHADYERTRQHK